MRCKACNREDAHEVREPDGSIEFYCTDCINVILSASLSDFTLGDLYDILEVEDEDNQIINHLVTGGQR